MFKTQDSQCEDIARLKQYADEQDSLLKVL